MTRFRETNHLRKIANASGKVMRHRSSAGSLGTQLIPDPPPCPHCNYVQHSCVCEPAAPRSSTSDGGNPAVDLTKDVTIGLTFTLDKPITITPADEEDDSQPAKEKP